MKKSILLFASAVFVIIALWLTFFAPQRYGTHGDSSPCDENPRQQIFYTATTYFFMTRSSQPAAPDVGTCPYQDFAARTYALDVWIPALLFSFVSYKNMRHQRRSS